MLIMESLDILGHNVVMSAKPTEKNMEAYLNYIKKRDIRTVVVLMPLEDIYDYYGYNLLDVYEDTGLNVIYHPINDFGVPKKLHEYDLFVEEMGDALSKSNILIHCSAGLGRTGMVAATLLVKYKQFSSGRAIKVVRHSRYGTIETRGQELFISSYDYYINGV